MDPLSLGHVFSNLSVGIGTEVVSNLLDCAALAAGTQSAAVVAWGDDCAEIVAAYNLPLKCPKSAPVSAQVVQVFRQPIWALDVRSQIGGLIWPEFDVVGRYVVSVPIRGDQAGRLLTLTCFDNARCANRQPYLFDMLGSLATTLRHHLRLVSQVPQPADLVDLDKRLDAREPFAAYATETPASQNGEHSSVVSAFLLRTLQRKRRFLTRNGVGYGSVRTWTAALKPYQIAALKALKLSPPEPLINEIAIELVNEAMAIAGSNIVQSVTAVPCGHSGPGCLSQKLGQSVANRMDIPFVDAFEPCSMAGSSHPKTNVRRPAMKLRTQPNGISLLIDDVATSGSHIVEATKLLRFAGTPVVPLVWIAG
jgi:hypothetical protein